MKAKKITQHNVLVIAANKDSFANLSQVITNSSAKKNSKKAEKLQLNCVFFTDDKMNETDSSMVFDAIVFGVSNSPAEQEASLLKKAVGQFKEMPIYAVADQNYFLNPGRRSQSMASSTTIDLGCEELVGEVFFIDKDIETQADKIIKELLKKIHERARKEVEAVLRNFLNMLELFAPKPHTHNAKYIQSIYDEGKMLVAAVRKDIETYVRHRDARTAILDEVTLATECLPMHAQLLGIQSKAAVVDNAASKVSASLTHLPHNVKKKVGFAVEANDHDQANNQKSYSENLKDRVRSNSAIVPHPPLITRTQKRWMCFAGALLIGGALTFLILSPGASAPISLWMLKIGILNIKGSLALGQAAELSMSGLAVVAGAGLLSGAHVFHRSAGSAAAMQRFSATLSKQEKKLTAKEVKKEKVVADLDKPAALSLS